MSRNNQNDHVAKASHLSKYILPGISAIIAATIYWFWAFPYRAALSYREQLQLFQTTGNYLNFMASRPAGLSTYVSELLTQFFNNYWAGAAVMTVLLLAFFLLIYLINGRFSSADHKATDFTLALCPLMALWLYLGNPDVTVSFVVAVSLALAAAYIFTFLKNYIPMFAGTVLLYWLTGPATVVFSLSIISYVWRDSNLSVKQKAIFSAISIAWLAANICLWSCYLPYPLSYQLIGIGFSMMPDSLAAGQVIVEALCVVIPVVAIFISKVPVKVSLPVLIAAEVIAAVVIYPKAYDKTTYRLIDYDYLVRANNWNGILLYSDRHDPDLPLSVSATNLALGMTGQLDSRAFAYFQNGPEGMFPPFSKETLSSWTSGEIFFQLGLINSAQRFYFEGMEAIPNYNKSSRAIRRLAETAMIRGDYNVAEKYLRLLENTLFYKKWARRNLALIKEKGGVENHPLYGRLRARMIDEDYMFSEGELDKTLGQLFLKDPNNNLAKQYLIVYPLLQRDLNKFTQYMGVVAESQPQYNPTLAQQVMAFMSMQNGKPIPPGAVAPGIEQSLRDFARAWTSKDPSRLEPYRRTLYYYLLSNE